ncbi:MAG: adaptor protein MecA [Lachnospiraceae bacterium]
MTFKRIDEETVCCIVTEDDMIDNGLQLEDFLENKDNVQEFLHSIVEQAEEEVGYEMKKGVVSMQVAMLPEHKLAITFSEKENIGIRDMIDQMKKAMSAFEEEPLTGGEIVRGLEKEIKKEKNMDTEFSLDDTQERCAVVSFDTMETLLRVCRLFVADFVSEKIESGCYRLGEKYYLVLDHVKVKNALFLQLCGLVMEYGQREDSTEERIAYIKEHGICIVKKNAILRLAEI